MGTKRFKKVRVWNNERERKDLQEYLIGFGSGIFMSIILYEFLIESNPPLVIIGASIVVGFFLYLLNTTTFYQEIK